MLGQDTLIDTHHVLRATNYHNSPVLHRSEILEDDLNSFMLHRSKSIMNCQVYPQNITNITPDPWKHQLCHQGIGVELPVEIWSMVLDEIPCVKTLARLCQVSRYFLMLVIPRLYKRVGILYKSFIDIRIFGYEEHLSNISYFGRRIGVPITTGHWKYILHAHTLKLVDARWTDAMQKSNCGCVSYQQHHCGALCTGLTAEKRAKTNFYGWAISEASTISLSQWVNQKIDSLDILAQVLNLLHENCCTESSLCKLRKLQICLKKLNGFDGDTIESELALDRALSYLTGLEHLELTNICEPTTVIQHVGKYLRSPSGENVRELKLDYHSQPGPIEPLFDRQNFTKLRMKSLCFARFKAKTLSDSLDNIFDVSILTSLRLIHCRRISTLLGEGRGSGPVIFPNLKIFHIGGKYEHTPQFFGFLPILDELVVTVEARIEHNYDGGIRKFFRRKGHGLKRLAVKFVRLPRNSENSPSEYWEGVEKLLLDDIASYCRNLQQLGVRGAAIKEIIVNLPSLKAISTDIMLEHSRTVLATNIAMMYQQRFGRNGDNGSNDLRYIKVHHEAWEVVDSTPVRESTRAGTNYPTTMALIQLKRNKLRSQDIPGVFLVEEIEGEDECWGLTDVQPCFF